MWLLILEPLWEGHWPSCDPRLPALLPTGVHAVRDRCGRGVAGGAGPHVLQRETGGQVTAGEGSVLRGAAVCLWGQCSFHWVLKTCDHPTHLLLSADIKAAI